MRRSGLPAVAVSNSRQVFGSGATIAGLIPISRSAATGFGTARHHGQLPQRIDECGFVVRLRDSSIHLPRAHARHQRHHVEITREQAVSELNQVRILLKRYLAHRRRHERLAALSPDQFRNFRRTPALERQYLFPFEGHARL